MEWISVKDKLPEPGKKVLGYRPSMYYKFVQTVYYAGRAWENGYDLSGNFVITHWMPLPEPPEVK